jgi:hypothetical protein
MHHIVHQLAGTRVALRAIVGQFRLDYSVQGPQRLIRLVEVCLPDGTPVLDDYWCVQTAGMQALHLLEGDRISFEARITLHGTPAQRRVGVSPLLQDRVVTLWRACGERVGVCSQDPSPQGLSQQGRSRDDALARSRYGEWSGYVQKPVIKQIVPLFTLMV